MIGVRKETLKQADASRRKFSNVESMREESGIQASLEENSKLLERIKVDPKELHNRLKGHVPDELIAKINVGSAVRVKSVLKPGEIEVPFTKVQTDCDFRDFEQSVILHINEAGKLLSAEYLSPEIQDPIPSLFYGCTYRQLIQSVQTPFITIFNPAIRARLRR